MTSGTQRRPPKRTVGQRLQIIESLYTANVVELERVALRYLRDPSPSVRASVLDLIGQKKIPGIKMRLFPLLEDPNNFVRYSAIKCFGDLFEGQSIRAAWLDPFLADPSPLVRMECLDSFVKIRDLDALPEIAACLTDADPVVRAYSARSIARLDGRKYRKAIHAVARVEQDDNAKVGFAEALFILGDADQFETLLSLLSSAQYLARCASANALSDLDMDDKQYGAALDAVSYAGQNALARGDQTTMERVEMELRAR